MSANQTPYASLLQGLNEEQRIGATTLDHNVLVNAGAGTGKTHTLTQRYVYT
ncbi:MAG: UvrD-helicase domain-containing protein, partial [Coriobacteriia bacterium]|nr:UvrD-helicase domain-containing protein [Coriobacteriia bacterium]